MVQILDNPLDLVAATKLINRWSRDGADTVLTKHAEDRLYERDIGIYAVQRCLEEGEALDVRPPDAKHRDFRYRVQFVDGDDQLVTVVTPKQTNDQLLLVITAWPLGTQGDNEW